MYQFTSTAMAHAPDDPHPEAAAWQQFGGRHSFECYLSRSHRDAAGRRYGLCQCGNTCAECDSSARALAAVGLRVFGLRVARR